MTSGERRNRICSATCFAPASFGDQDGRHFFPFRGVKAMGRRKDSADDFSVTVLPFDCPPLWAGNRFSPSQWKKRPCTGRMSHCLACREALRKMGCFGRTLNAIAGTVFGRSVGKPPQTCLTERHFANPSRGAACRLFPFSR